MNKFPSLPDRNYEKELWVRFEELNKGQKLTSGWLIGTTPGKYFYQVKFNQVLATGQVLRGHIAWRPTACRGKQACPFAEKCYGRDYEEIPNQYDFMRRWLIGSPFAKIIPVFLISVLLAFLLKDYHYFRFQKTYFLLTYSLLFSFFLYYLALSAHLPNFDFKLFYRSHANRTRLVIALVFSIILMLIFIELPVIRAKLNLYPSWLLDYYNLAELTVCYQTFGLIKRGLLPTIVNFFSPNYYTQIIWIKIIGLMVFLGGLISVAFGKPFSLGTRKLFLAVFLLTPVGIIYQFIYPGSLYDLVLIGILFCASSLINRPTSLIFDVAGLLVHEAYLFLRLPFILMSVVSALLDSGKGKKYNLITLFSLGALIIGFLIMTSDLARRDRTVMETNFYEKYPHLPVRNLNHLRAFDPMAKDATMVSQVNQMTSYFHGKAFRTSLMLMLGCLVIIGLLVYFFNNLEGRQKRLDLFYSLGSFLFPLLLCFVGLDYGRWMNFAFVSWICYYLLFRQKLFPRSVSSANCLYGVLLVAFIIYPTGIYEHSLMSILWK